MKKIIATALTILMLQFSFAQGKLTMDNVQKAYIKGSGPIYENKQVKGYYVFYESDKIDRKTREYTIQILDENSNAVKKTTFQDDKDVMLYDAEFNETNLCFFFINTNQKKYIYKIYDLTGKLAFEYEKEYESKDLGAFSQGFTMLNKGREDDAVANVLIAIPKLGFASVLPKYIDKKLCFEIGYYSSNSKKEAIYQPEFESSCQAVFLASEDSTIYLEINKGKTGKSFSAGIFAFNVVKQKVAFDLSDKFDPKYKTVPAFLTKDPQSENLILVSAYFEENDNIIKDYGLGLALYKISKQGKILSTVYNSWQESFAKYLPVDKNGKIDEVGYLAIQDIQKTPDGKIYVLCEGYKRKFDAGGVALSAIGFGNGGFTKIVITDIVMLEFDNNIKMSNVTRYSKRQFTAINGPASDYYSQHMLAYWFKLIGMFDYTFTSVSKDNSSFSFCYTDWEKTDEHKGGTFNSIKYSNGKFSTDKIPLTSKAKYTKIFPAKPGYVGIYEYFKKEKKIEFHLEKLN